MNKKRGLMTSVTIRYHPSEHLQTVLGNWKGKSYQIRKELP